ncbi:replication protein A 70 kDa DNA-binding subunit C-like [Cornus florida]|uniref:replication protein A 70 kDa DNA-binding subunit C-like n=1 Tax=Cornus florida TaxID=4283 RepID=UPI0028A27E43|nr:replication protein A 70 kDa DNA-binding subunit C-like [Cornus florida]
MPAQKRLKIIKGFSQLMSVIFEGVERALTLETDIKDKDARREQWKQKRGARPSSEGSSWKKNKSGSSQFQGQQSVQSAPTTPMLAGSDKSGVICFQCQQPGHYKSSCPLKSFSVSSAPKDCYGCGQQGHLIRDCPSQGIGTDSSRGSRQMLS